MSIHGFKFPFPKLTPDHFFTSQGWNRRIGIVFWNIRNPLPFIWQIPTRVTSYCHIKSTHFIGLYPSSWETNYEKTSQKFIHVLLFYAMFWKMKVEMINCLNLRRSISGKIIYCKFSRYDIICLHVVRTVYWNDVFLR